MKNLCPICNHSGSPFLKIDAQQIHQCDACYHQYLEAERTPPIEIYDNSYFNSGKAGYPNYHQEGEMLRERGRWYAKKLQRYMSPGKVLDVGAAAGYLLQGYIDNGWTGRGLEPNQSMVSYGQEKLSLDMVQGFLEIIDPSEKYDLVSLIQVVGHFYDLSAAMEKIALITKPGGHLLIESWKRDSFTAKLFGSSWHEYSPPSVRHWYTTENLTDLAKKYGFRKVATGRPKKSISGKHARSLLKHKGIKDQLVTLIPEKLLIPYPFDDVFWILFTNK